MALKDIESLLAMSLKLQGLEPRGWLSIEARDIPSGSVGIEAGEAALLVGSHGSAMWDAFTLGSEYWDGAPDPLDRWTRRVIHSALAELPVWAMPLFPFGPELWPFQLFAMRAMGIKPSPLGMLVHPQFGLWHALRAAIVVPGMHLEASAPHKVIHACEKCDEQFCLNACPVGAFSASGFAVDACRGYLASPPGETKGPDCMGEGCAARNACPVGLEWRYGQAQIRFHMAAFSR